MNLGWDFGGPFLVLWEFEGFFVFWFFLNFFLLIQSHSVTQAVMQS